MLIITLILGIINVSLLNVIKQTFWIDNKMNSFRKNFSIILKFVIVAFVVVGITVSLSTYHLDGYSRWSKRLLYFTTQSNLWIGTLDLILAVKLLKKKENLDVLYALKLAFTVSIAMTMFVYCVILGPNADESYRAWSFSSIILHVIVPALAIADFFIDNYPILYTKKHLFFTTIPPLIYLVFASILHLFSVDFGRGDTYAYFFLNFSTPAGLFGIMENPPTIGSFYWIVFFLIFVLMISAFFISTSPTNVIERRKKSNKKTKKSI